MSKNQKAGLSFLSLVGSCMSILFMANGFKWEKPEEKRNSRIANLCEDQVKRRRPHSFIKPGDAWEIRDPKLTVPTYNVYGEIDDGYYVCTVEGRAGGYVISEETIRPTRTLDDLQ